MNTTAQRSTWRDASLETTAVAGVALVLSTLFVSWIVLPSRKDGGIYELGGFSILRAWPFFSKRYDFIRSNFQRTGALSFKFNVLQHSVIAVRGPEARKAFFDNKNLSFVEGYKILMGAAPVLTDISVDLVTYDTVSWFNQQLLVLLQRDRLADLLPTLFDDVHNRMVGWGKEGRIDPFKNVYDLVFQMTVRMSSCRELADDIDAITHLQSLYWTLEKSATPAALLLPWFPSRARKAKDRATKELYMTLYKYVQKRQEANVPTADAIDVLLSRGQGVNETIQCTLAIIFAGVVNTGINSCWVLFFLAENPEWKAKVVAEVKALIAHHTNTTSTEPLHKRLSAIPVSAWEDDMPVMESVIRETIRIIFNNAALRRNVMEDMSVGDTKVLKGNFMIYSVADTHLNPDIYTDPYKFDPDRFSSGREEDKKVPHGYLGWGSGRHPCTGMKFAKLEIKIIVALFVAGYEFEIVDKSGMFPDPLPRPNYNDLQQARPLGDPCYLKYKRVVE